MNEKLSNIDTVKYRLILRNICIPCAASAVSVACATALRLGPLGGLEAGFAWLTFYPAVAASALYGGPAAGVLSTSLACLVVKLLLPVLAAEPLLAHPADGLGMAVFAITGVLISAASRTPRRAPAEHETFAALVRSMDQGFCVIEIIHDRDGKPTDYRFIEINPSFEAQTGLREAKGRRMRQMVPNHEAFWFETYGEVARTGKEIRFENPADAMGRYFDVFAFRVGGHGSRRVGILFNDISARRKIEQELLTTARHDKLTGLANRAMFEEYLPRALSRSERGRQSLALLFLDLDNFKAVNDELGHPAGDMLLRSVAQRLLASVRAGDLVCRIGGDEFTIIQENCEPGHMEALAQRIIQAMSAPVEFAGRPIRISTSIGIVTYPECGDDGETLIQRADAAMYAAKKDGGSRSTIWRPSRSATPKPGAGAAGDEKAGPVQAS
jgi:diguanylate cyclase (GGDEF)-like protein